MRICLGPLLVWVVIVASAGAAPVEKPVATALVRGKVKSVETKFNGNAELVVVEITHVYAGSPELKGTTFRDAYQAASTTGMEASTQFKVDEEGVWALRANTDGELWPELDDRYPFARRSRKVDNKRHAQIVKLAEAVESVETAKPGDRSKMLVDLTADDTPEVGVWAALALGRSDDPAAGKFLDGFAEKPDAKLPLAAQAAMDEVLCKNKWKAWVGSKPRTELLKGWVTGKADEYQAMRALKRINDADQDEQLLNKLAVELVCTAAENTDWPLKARQRAVYLVGAIGERVPENSAFDWLFDQARNNKDVEFRRAAASSLNRLPLSSERRKVVEDYLIFEKDEKVADALRAAVKKAKESK